ncbi:WxL domain-containing protein [Enterococcus hirae]|uniref:WxL domain-containing protein n=1 Tax=Enterococcus TaxID=1350 RepID=UPI0015F295E9|nr:WxL domain-containing protein [Enterococcus hirae]EMF0079085.1 WxL domain-containing protein [Enterococcus hirae]EMF0241555.1 WxL domain-containing protein [Enterococcus hirae]MBA5279887.1 WxL domain-containing protein [Enterococcus hirae]
MKKQALLAAVSLVAPVVIGSTGVFADDTNTTSVTAQFTVSQNNSNPTPPNPSDPDHPDGDTNTNKPLDPAGNFALAYIPNDMDFGTMEISAQGSLTQQLTLASGQSINVGVKDTQHNTQGWTLTAQLSGDLANVGATIDTQASTAKVYDNQGSLQSLPTGDMIQVNQNVKIGAASQEIMKGIAGNTFSGTYDLNLGTPTLDIPDVSRVNAGSASDTITWNLTQTP